MLLFRWMIFVALLVALVAFGLYAGTGQRRFLRVGLVTMKWAVIAGLGFFGVLILERLA